MHQRTLTLVAVVTATILTVSAMSAAQAIKPDKPGKPTTTTTTAAPSTGLTCAELDASGAMWDVGLYDDNTRVYTVRADGGCIDIRPEHLAMTDWTVRLTGEASRFKGLKMLFERGVHGDVYAEFTLEPDEGRSATFDNDVVWNTTVGPVDEPLVFVSMKHSADRWVDGATITLIPTAEP
jgi:hypothetical protein